jgi:hypothetical protein
MENSPNLPPRPVVETPTACEHLVRRVFSASTELHPTPTQTLWCVNCGALSRTGVWAKTRAQARLERSRLERSAGELVRGQHLCDCTECDNMRLAQSSHDEADRLELASLQRVYLAAMLAVTAHAALLAIVERPALWEHFTEATQALNDALGLLAEKIGGSR